MTASDFSTRTFGSSPITLRAGVEASRVREKCDYVIVSRNICRPDGSIQPIEDEGEERHVDTSCFFLLPGSYHVFPFFARMPPEVALLCERMFYISLAAKDLIAVRLQQKTAHDGSLWEYADENAGEPAPPHAKPAVDVERIRDWRGASKRRGNGISSSAARASGSISAKPVRYPLRMSQD
jgi:hypothetical protein